MKCPASNVVDRIGTALSPSTIATVVGDTKVHIDEGLTSFPVISGHVLLCAKVDLGTRSGFASVNPHKLLAVE